MLDLNLVFLPGEFKGLAIAVEAGVGLVEFASPDFERLLKLKQVVLLTIGLLAEGCVVFVGPFASPIPLGLPGFEFLLELGDVLGLPGEFGGSFLESALSLGVAALRVAELLRDLLDVFGQLGLGAVHPLALRRKELVDLLALLAQRLGELICPILVGRCWGGRGFHGRR